MRLTPKRVILLSILVLIVLVVGTLGLSVFGPSPLIVVSRETTYLTEPLDPWGKVEYAEAIRRQMSEGVTPENNAAVLIWQALGPRDIPAERRPSLYSELGIAPLPEEGDYYLEHTASEPVKQQAIEWIRAKQAADDASEDGWPPDPDLGAAELEYRLVNSRDAAFEEFLQLTD